MAAPTAPARSDLIVGIGKVSRNDGVTTYISQDETEFSINLRESLANVMIGGQTIDKRWVEYTGEMTINPDGRLTAAALAQFWNNQSNFLPGVSIFGSADVPAIVTGSELGTHTLKATAWTGLPSLRLHPERGAIGPATLTAIIGSGKNWTDADAFYEHSATGGTFTDATWVPSDPLRQQYSAAFGAVGGLTDWQAQDGFTVDFRMSVNPIKVGGITRDMKFGGLEVMVRCIPAKPTTAQLLAALKVPAASAGLTGFSHFSNAAALTVTGSDGVAHVSIPKAALVTGGFTFSGEKLRTGEIAFYACRNYATGAQSALYTIA